MKNKILVALLALASFAAPALAQENNGITSGSGQSPIHFEYQFRANSLFTKRTCFSMGADEQFLNATGRMYGLLAPLSSATTGAMPAEVVMAKNTFGQTPNSQGNGLHIRVYGTTAANANTKVVQLIWGSQTITLLNAASNAKDFYADVHIYNTGVNTQEICVAGYANAALLNGLSVAGTQTTTAPITVGINLPTATTAGDVVLNEIEIEGESGG